ncbi:MAG: type I restriction enzyme HsdR N-terminal domain-containing protein [Bacteroidota bacterium]
MSTDSITRFHFPMVRFSGREKHLWNPILKKQYKQRPEERVRLKTVEVLLAMGVSQTRMAFEHPVHLPGDKSSSRTDIVVFDKAVKPLLLVECKEPDVHLTEQTALQYGRYNEVLNAPFGLLTNGIQDIWISYEDGTTSTHTHPPHSLFAEPFPISKKKTFAYWRDRGFAGEHHTLPVEEHLSAILSQWFLDPSSQNPVYLSFAELPLRFGFDGYYAIPLHNDRYQLAITCSATREGGTVLNAVLNEQGVNTCLFSLPVQNATVSTLITPAGIQEMEIPVEELLRSPDIAERLVELMK